MTNGSPLTKKDAVVLVVLIGCSLANLAAVGASGRSRAKEYVCQSNLRQWGVVFEGLAAENNGQFVQGSPGTAGYHWPWFLPDEVKDWTQNRIWLCPSAAAPISRSNINDENIYNSWGIYSQTEYGRSPGPKGINGSYGLNGYFIPISGSYERGVPASEGWPTLYIAKQAANVPVMVDALRFDLWPTPTEAPATIERAAWSSNASHMARCCINRHNGGVGCLFADGSVRKAGLKELWTLKWHRSFNTAGPWTLAGGVAPEKWPAWIRPFTDY